MRPEMKKPQRVRDARASNSNVVNDQEENVMSKNTTAQANVIPFDFGNRQVRAMLIDDQPWFVAADVSAALEYRDAGNMARNLDEDEKGTQIVSTLGGDQEMLVINQSGLYSAILRSRKAEAKRFKKWVTAEVLPAIRKHGRYEDASGKMGTLIDAAIGVTELTALNGVIRQKAAIVRKDRRRSFIHTMHSRLHTRFNVPRTELILAKDFEAACNFVAAYAIEGEFLPKQEEPAKHLDIHYPADCLEGRRPGMRHPCNQSSDFLDVSLLDLIEPFESPCEAILCKLSRAGYNVDGAWWELRTYRNKLFRLRSLIANLQHGFESPHQYVIKREVAA